MRRTVIAAVTVLALVVPATASAFDTGPHTDLTRDALAAEGFGHTAADVAVINNWFVDIYSNAKSVPHSGHSSFLKELLAGSFGWREHWSKDVVDATVRSHFDSTLPELATVAGAEQEIDRLNRATGIMARQAKLRRNPLELLTVIGMSLHPLQDFYAHTNWMEPQGVIGADGPAWAALAFGATPTWYDVQPADRTALGIYTGGTPNHDRIHGGWNSDRNRSLKTSLNKDWPGRPGYDNAYVTAYFASRQWVQGLRAWVNDEALWRQAQAYSKQFGGDLAHDLWGATWIGMFSGHWSGEGEPCNPEWSLNICGGRHGPGGWGGESMVRGAPKEEHAGRLV